MFIKNFKVTKYGVLHRGSYSDDGGYCPYGDDLYHPNVFEAEVYDFESPKDIAFWLTEELVKANRCSSVKNLLLGSEGLSYEWCPNCNSGVINKQRYFSFLVKTRKFKAVVKPGKISKNLYSWGLVYHVDFIDDKNIIGKYHHIERYLNSYRI